MTGSWTSRSSRTSLNKERVLRAAVDLADGEGLAALSMRRLGQELGVEAMSLYNPVADKEDVLDGMVDVVVREIEEAVSASDAPRTPSDWKGAMRQRAMAARGVILQHPWARGLIVSRPNPGTGMVRYIDSVIGALREGGLSAELDAPPGREHRACPSSRRHTRGLRTSIK